MSEQFDIPRYTDDGNPRLTRFCGRVSAILGTLVRSGTIVGGPAGGIDHAGLSNLDYAHAGHTDFAGTLVSNDFVAAQTISAGAGVVLSIPQVRAAEHRVGDGDGTGAFDGHLYLIRVAGFPDKGAAGLRGGSAADLRVWNGKIEAIAGVFAGSGASITSLDAGNVSSGTLADARLSPNVPLKDAANAFTAAPQSVTSDDDANRCLDLIGHSTGQTAALLRLLGNNTNSDGLARLEWKSRTGARPLTISNSADNLRLLFGANGTDSFLVSIGGLSAGGSYFLASNNGEGFGFEANGSGSIQFGSSSTASAFALDFGVRPDSNSICSGTVVNFYGASFASQLRDALTATPGTYWNYRHLSSGTPTAGFGGTVLYSLDSTTTADRAAADVTVSWVTATDASRKARVSHNVYDTAAREGLRLEADGARATAQVPAGGSASFARVGGSLFDHFADAGNSTTTETDLYSDTAPAAALSVNGDKLEAEYGGVFVSSATATRQIRLYFGGTAIFDTGALTLSLSAAWTMYVLIARKDATTVRYMVSLTTEGAALAAYTAGGELSGLTLTATNVLKVTGQAAGVGAASNDVVAKVGAVYFHPAA